VALENKIGIVQAEHQSKYFATQKQKQSNEKSFRAVAKKFPRNMPARSRNAASAFKNSLGCDCTISSSTPTKGLGWKALFLASNLMNLMSDAHIRQHIDIIHGE